MKKDFLSVINKLCEIEHPHMFLPQQHSSQREIFKEHEE
jgi:hypothetical protein